MAFDNGTDEGVAELAKRLKDVHIQTPQQANELHEAKLTAHEDAINTLKKWFEAHKCESKERSNGTEAKFEALQDAYNKWCNIMGFLEDRINRDGSKVDAEIQSLYDHKDYAHDALDYLLNRLGVLQNRGYTIDSLKELIEGHNSNLKAAIELCQNKDLTSEETTKAVDSSVRTLTENGKEVNDLYNKELENQLDAFRAKNEYYSAEQGLVKAEIDGLKATLEDYAKENKSLKDEIHAQKSEITALKDQNWTFKLQMSSVLYTIGPLENKVQRLSDEVRNLKKLTK